MKSAQSRSFVSQFGVFQIDTVIGFFDVSTHDLLPFNGFSIKVIMTQSGEFQATPNVQVVNSATRCIEYVCGLGTTASDSIDDCIAMLLNEAVKQRDNKMNLELDESDFIWLNWQPYIQLSMGSILPPSG